ncbi:hypothetical protein EVAR_8814_1 [Eumeta japonica]|uniref:Uncharacterized protein n=1 Tax=Eumeta variegata TaxID=151549 RepID=A0A4C1TUK3_EUMVA|nr:hypothetical protein EVAR_8814_1 [Eumeta japonica]
MLNQTEARASLSPDDGRRRLVSYLQMTLDVMNQFRKLMSYCKEPIQNNYRPLQEREERHVFFINPHWSQYNTLLPIPRILDPSLSILSPVYRDDYSLLPVQNAYMIPKLKEEQWLDDPVNGDKAANGYFADEYKRKKLVVYYQKGKPNLPHKLKEYLSQKKENIVPFVYLELE